jgi:hypothetical protein
MIVALRHILILVVLVVGFHAAEAGVQVAVPADPQAATVLSIAPEISGKHIDSGCHVVTHMPVMARAGVVAAQPAPTARPRTDYAFNLRTFQPPVATPPPIV